MPTFPTRPQGIRYPVGQKSLPLIEIEVFLDFNCPFSRKIFNRVMEVSSSNNIEGVQLVFQVSQRSTAHNIIYPLFNTL